MVRVPSTSKRQMVFAIGRLSSGGKRAAWLAMIIRGGIEQRGADLGRAGEFLDFIQEAVNPVNVFINDLAYGTSGSR